MATVKIYYNDSAASTLGYVLEHTQPGDPVQFDTTQGAKGMKAVHVLKRCAEIQAAGFKMQDEPAASRNPHPATRIRPA